VEGLKNLAKGGETRVVSGRRGDEA
jgi:hypothetical protein